MLTFTQSNRLSIENIWRTSLDQTLDLSAHELCDTFKPWISTFVCAIAMLEWRCFSAWFLWKPSLFSLHFPSLLFLASFCTSIQFPSKYFYIERTSFLSGFEAKCYQCENSSGNQSPGIIRKRSVVWNACLSLKIRRSARSKKLQFTRISDFILKA